ncbi:hypothetical protein Tco_0755555 [Tanacetum coccineum]
MFMGCLGLLILSASLQLNSAYFEVKQAVLRLFGLAHEVRVIRKRQIKIRTEARENAVKEYHDLFVDMRENVMDRMGGTRRLALDRIIDVSFKRSGSVSRESILKTLLAKEKVENLEFKELAVMTEGHSGSDLKVDKNDNLEVSTH